MRERPRAHDLVRLTPRACARLGGQAPPWVTRSLGAAPWAAVRRARVASGVAIGVRGVHRGERFAAVAAESEIAQVVTPEALLRCSPRREHRAFAALAVVARAAEEAGLAIGPIGAAGFEIATGIETLHQESDLDLVVRASPSHPEMARFAGAIQRLPLRVDVELDVGNGCGVALDEALRGGRVLVKTPDGPQLLTLSLADAAVQALVDEAALTPKPALVDRRGSGAHRDLSLDLLLRSARALHGVFDEIARASKGRDAEPQLRARLGAIGREGERRMLAATGGVNTHRGAIWSLGLLVAAASITAARDGAIVAATAASLASLPDPERALSVTNGARARAAFGVRGAPGEAESGFPHVVDVALPHLRRSRERGNVEDAARIDAMLAIMTTLDDTCLLHRGGVQALQIAQEGAQEVLAAGGVATPSGARALQRLESLLLERDASPGGAADLLAATLLLDAIEYGVCV
jgi:triphosphoribosyl-dephospho-CoA synthase